VPRKPKKARVRRLRQERKEPYRCPVCQGKATVPRGFYGDQQAVPNAVEPCRTCGGSGIVWTPHVEEQEAVKRSDQ
jgi:ribosomal protein L37AE/L43A